ncbi:cytochrome b5-related protein [Zeugodacus cucurbitae]|uniref:Cytochrome b5-related protein n=1 Tax=Zeugodacus cucurbitae TaxID=28588 RepID=A0A0A1WN02_ZEUCU|nr:cytochrome b5-related protein [Zeugodacus cucurbitae]XP_028900168.1 cytochrome b5-related protein [Zeugodacus cucurbitae]
MNKNGMTDIKQEDWRVSRILRKYPVYREKLIKTCEGWTESKQKDDEAEGLWRIKDELYDLTEFIPRHPGGSFWLEWTKGTDITEAFESHHISKKPEDMLAKFHVRSTSTQRNYKISLHDNGFYRVLKSRVRDKLKNVDRSPERRSDLIHFGLLLSTTVFALACSYTGYITLALLAGLSLSWLTIASHNYLHRKDNWQMYTFNLSLMNFCNWRVLHAMSHHVYPNSLIDLEMSLFEPYLCWWPNSQVHTKWIRLFNVTIQPIVYSLIFPFQIVLRIIVSLLQKNILFWHDIIGFILPLSMLLVAQVPVSTVLRQWGVIIGLASFIFGLTGLNAGHHDPKIFHDGDAEREDRDWGLYQLDTIIDRSDIKGSQFLVLTHFGEHFLHHLFPTLDHGILPQLYPVLFETLNEYQAQLRECSHWKQIIGQNKQLLRTKPNALPPTCVNNNKRG